MADYTFDFSAQTTANPWTPSAPIKKSSTNNLQIVNGSGVKSATNTQISYGVHDVNYTLGSTQIRAEVNIGAVVFASDRVGAAIIARSGANAGAGYAAIGDNYGTIYVYKVSAAGALTQIGSVGSITLAANDLIGLGYQQSTNTLTVYQNGTSKTTVTDATYNADTTLGAGWITDPQNLNAQYVKRLLSTGVATGPTIASISTLTHLGTATITGTGFPTSQTGSAAVTIGGISQTVTWNTTTSCSISSADIGTNKFGTNVSLILTDASGNSSAGYTTQFAARSGGAYVNLSGTMASSGNRITSTPDLASGDQVEYYGATGGTIPADVTVNSDGSYDVASGVTAFNFRVNNGVDWGTAGTETIGTLPSLSSLIPSGTIGTQTTATIGATTDQSSGTLYYVLSATQGDITGITVAQVKAGNNSSGVAATKSGNTTVSTSTPSISVTGLTANTTYYYAEVQNTTAGDSIVYTGSFSTAANVVASNERNIHQAIHQPIYKAIGRAI